jgi:hypothetical protein
MLDAAGEVVAEAGTSDQRHRLIGIYQGIVLAAARGLRRSAGAQDRMNEAL